jgi:hypothetical protein
MKRLKPWLVKLPLIVPIGWVLYSAWVDQGFSSVLTLVLVFGVFGLGFYGLMWATERIFDFVTGSKRDHQQADSTCSVSDFGNVNFENIKFDIPAGHHVAGISHLPECEDIISSCIEGVTSCLEGLHH